MFGEPLRLPADFFDDPTSPPDVPAFVNRLRQHVRELKPVPFRHHSKRSVYVHPELMKATHVFVRHNAVRRPLQPTYDGPFAVVSRTDKVFKIATARGEKSISIDRVKPAFLLAEPALLSPSSEPLPVLQPVPDPSLTVPTGTKASSCHSLWPPRTVPCQVSLALGGGCCG